MPAPPKHIWLLYLFALALLADLLAVQLEMESLRLVTKPSLMILLIIFVSVQLRLKNKWKNCLIAALFFSLCGDVFLMFDKQYSMFFIFGLLSFLIAHVFYIILFLALKRYYYHSNAWNFVSMFVLILYVSVLFYFLYPSLGDLKVPVIVYALVLAAMFFVALHVNSGFLGNPLIWMGAFLFVVSDSILAFNKFHSSFSGASLMIMITYALAQLLIVYGVIKLIRSADIR